jgi:hypothetical protein
MRQPIAKKVSIQAFPKKLKIIVILYKAANMRLVCGGASRILTRKNAKDS